MDTQGGDIFRTLLSYLTTSIDSFPDLRRGKNTQYSMKNIALSAFAVLFCQSPSFLAHQQLMEQAQGEGESFRSLGNTLLVAIDGTGYFQSESIHCERCMVSHHKDGRTTYSHSTLMPAVVKPGRVQVIALEPEFMVPQDGHEKQDCESEAAKRWIRECAARYSSLGITLLGDGLYATQPMIEMVMEEELDYIFVVKPLNHKYLYEELEPLGKLGEIRETKRTQGTGKKRRRLVYRYINAVPLKDGKHPVEVNWVEVTMTDDSGKGTFHTAFVTNHPLTEQNVEELVEAGRCRWKIENEDINTLETKGYHFEHNFGHGKRYLSQTLLALNILAFLFHTVLELRDKRYALLRERLPRRDTFYQHIATLTQ